MLFFSVRELSLLSSAHSIDRLVDLVSCKVVMVYFPANVMFFVTLVFVKAMSSVVNMEVSDGCVVTVVV